MQLQQTEAQQVGAGVRGIGRPRWWHRGGIERLAVLAGLLLLPLDVEAQRQGDLDNSFSGDGLVFTDFQGGSDFAFDVALQPDGKIIAVGSASVDSRFNTALARYLPNGKLDKTFGNAGRVITDLGEDSSTATAAVLQPNGNIVVAAEVSTTDDEQGFDLAVVRYLPNGQLDTTFADKGWVTNNFGYYDAVPVGVALQPNGNVVVGGYVHSLVNGNTEFAVVRYLPNGQLDTTFGNAGLATTGTDIGSAVAMVRQLDGKVLVAGVLSRGFSGADIAVARFLKNGELDAAFGDAGVATTDFGIEVFARDMALQPDGKIIVAGWSRENDTSDNTNIAVTRFLKNGELDTTFGNAGLMAINFGYGAPEAAAVALQEDDKIVVAANLSDIDFNDIEFAVARFLPNGQADTKFGNAGLSTSTEGSRLRSLVIQPHDGRLVVAGLGSGGPGNFVAARYHAIACDMTVVTRAGTAGNDTIVGTSGRDVVYGFAGNDLISGLGGHDLLCGGKGNDTLRGGGGNDILRGGPDTDKCDGGAGSGDQAMDCERRSNVP